MTLNGIDISGWQKGMDVRQVPGDFAIVKATGGVSFVADAADALYQSAKAAGKLLGVYHFARESGCAGTAVAEADWFIANTLGYQDGKTLLILDWEGDNTPDVGWALQWLMRVEAKTGIKPLIYMNQSVENSFDWSAVVAQDFGLWLAQYPAPNSCTGYQIPTGPPPVRHWQTLAMWQYTSGGRLAGWGSVLDLNVFYGDANAWAAYAKKNGAITSQPAPVPVAVTAAPVAHPAGSTCVVSPNDTLSGIAAQVGISLAALEAENPGINYDLIQPGQVLHLPAGANIAALTGSAPAPVAAPAAPAGPPSCIVDGGDTLSGIGNQFGVPWQTIAQLNGISAPYVIYPGQVLRLR